jgi:membrane protein
MNQLWAVPVAERPGLGPAYGRGALFLLVVGAGLIITTGLSGLTTAVGTMLPGSAAAETVARIASTLLAIAVNVGLIVVAFRMLTFRHITFRQHLPGAAVAAIAWQLLLLVGTYLVTHELQGTSASYGVFGIVLGLLAWIYFSTLIILLCAELNTVRVLRLTPRSLLSVAEPADTAVTTGDRRAFTAYARAQRRKTFQQVASASTTKARSHHTRAIRASNKANPDVLVQNVTALSVPETRRSPADLVIRGRRCGDMIDWWR